MSITFGEHAESRALTQTTGGQGQRLRWTGRGSTDQAAMRSAFLGLAPTTWDDLTFVGFDVKPYGVSGKWDCTADYGYSVEQAAGVRPLTVPGINDPLGIEFEFDISAKQVHITQSLRTVTSRYDSTDGGLNPTAWASGTAYAAGDTVANGGNIYVCTTAGTSGGGGPSGTGTGISDGTVVWNYVGPAGATLNVWTQNTAYSVGDRVDSHGFIYECTVAGTSSTTSDGPEGAGGAIDDGSARWKYVSPDLDPAAPDYGQAIAVTRDRVNGTDIYVGCLEFCVTAQVYPLTLVTITDMLNLVGKFNQRTYYNFPTKTLLYMGCTGSPRPGDIWTLKHRFAASPNLRNVAVGSKITMPFKGGHDFLWAAYKDAVVRTPRGSFTVQKPYAAYVEQVLLPGDFDSLPIG